MLTLYYRPSCPYCKKVLAAADELKVTFELKDVSAEESSATELVALGGKYQVPFLVDEARGEMLYESDDIITYMTKHGGSKSNMGTVRVHKSSGASQVCG
jgi:glutathione S-transferase